MISKEYLQRHLLNQTDTKIVKVCLAFEILFLHTLDHLLRLGFSCSPCRNSNQSHDEFRTA